MYGKPTLRPGETVSVSTSAFLRTDRSIVNNRGIFSHLGEGDFGTDAPGRVGEEHGLTYKR